MFWDFIVFGPIKSRRLGSSLGINLLPRRGKICNFDCIYCECGWNADGRGDNEMPSAAQVREALEEKLRQMRTEGTPVDSITMSGDGEPTLHPDFPAIIRDTIALRDRYYPDAKVSVLSNATRIGRKEVFDALRMVDNPILKLDAPTDELAARINRPSKGYSVAATIEAMKAFKGDFILQTMLLKGPQWYSGSDEIIKPWMDIVRELKPREVMVYTLDRPAPLSGLEALNVEEMRDLVRPLMDEGFSVQIKGKVTPKEQGIQEFVSEK